jgi:glycosyltransferase involved in cell wall biosynthesis
MTGGLTQDAKPWLTVIMPVYRGERWVEQALQSLASQSDDGVELIVIDSSPDSATADIVRRFSGRWRLRLEEKSSLPSWQTKTNKAAEMASADHICWLHHDDLWLEGRAAAIRDWICAAPKAALHLAGSQIIDEAGRSLGVWRCPFDSDGPLDPTMLLERLLVQNFISAPAPVYRKDAWLAAGGLDENLWYTGDWDIWLKLAAQGPVHHHREVTTAFRVHGSSLTATGSRDGADFERQMQIVLDRHLPRLATHRGKVHRAGIASIKVNGALAAAASGHLAPLLPALGRVLALGPAGIHRYIRDSRIADRLIPRVRAKLMGSF